MLKFQRFDPKMSTDVQDIEGPMLCSFGLTELAIPAIASVLGSVGIGASTAGGIASVLGPTLVQAGLGAGLGALTGQPGTGALLGAVNGGMGPLSQALGGAGGGYGQAATGALNAASGIPGGANPVTITPAANDTSVGAGNASGQTGAGTAMGATGQQMGQSPLASSSGGIAGGLQGPLAMLAALAQNANRPSTTAPTPSGFNDPFNPQGVNRTATPGYVPTTGSYYTYGQSSNPQFFQGNQVHLARGGALNRNAATFETGGDSHFVEGDGDGTSDDVPARLSDGEYVLTAQDVARVGQGSTQAGVKKLDQMREHIAHDAGAKQFQPRVKSPLHYLREAA